MTPITAEELALREARVEVLEAIEKLADRLAVQNARLRRERDEAMAELIRLREFNGGEWVLATRAALAKGE